MELFDHIYLINMKRRPDRLNVSSYRLRREKIKFEVFEAIDGYDRIYDSICKKILMKNESNQDYWIKSRGAIGIIMTYQKLLEDAQAKKYKNILILEDDISFHKQFRFLIEQKKKVIDFSQADAIWLGANQYRFDQSQLNEINDPSKDFYSVSNIKWCYTFGAYALGLSQRLIPLLRRSLDLDTMKYPIDVELYWTLANHQMNGRVIKPFLVLPDVTDSDNMGERDQDKFVSTRKYNLDDYTYFSLSKIGQLKIFLNQNRISIRNLCSDSKYDLKIDKSKLNSIHPFLNELLNYLSNDNQILIPDLLAHLEDRNSFVFVVPSYNNIDNFKINLDSIRKQIYPESQVRVIYIDDCSDDGTSDNVKEYFKKHQMENQVMYIRLHTRQRQGLGRFLAYHMSFDDEILLMLDGDDWLFNEHVLNNIDQNYRENNILTSYGGYYIYTGGDKEMGTVYSELQSCCEFPEEVLSKKTFRHYQWITRHLRNGYANLFKNIEVKHLLDPNRNFLKMVTDVNEMIPVLEQAQFRQNNIKKPTYVYNKDNSLKFDTSYYLQNQLGNENNKVYRELIMDRIKKKPYYHALNWDRVLRPYQLKIEKVLNLFNLEKLECDWILYQTEWKSWFRYFRANPLGILSDESKGEIQIYGLYGEPGLRIERPIISSGLFHREKLISYFNKTLDDVVLVPCLHI